MLHFIFTLKIQVTKHNPYFDNLNKDDNFKKAVNYLIKELKTDEMNMKTNGHKSTATLLPKCPTGIQGLDEITGGGLPRGRPTLICGGAGCGKTLLAEEFLVRGATEFGEPGVLMAFEETEKELKANVEALTTKIARLPS